MSLQASFDKQAKAFNRRAGIDDPACHEIVNILSGFYRKTDQKVWLEIGAGTGQIGVWALEHTKKYFGLDISGEMLNEFRDRLSDKQSIDLREFDASNQWPLEDDSVSLTFSSRTVHLLSPQHVFNEIKRVHRGGYFLIGRLAREQTGNIKDEMRKKMREILASMGHESRRGEENRKQLLDLFCKRGGKKIESIKAASWQEISSPNHSINSWLSKDGLAGQEIDDSIKKECMKRLSASAKDRYGSLDYQEIITQTYLIEGVELHSLH